MDEALARKSEREMLDYLQACGGQARWVALPLWKFQELQKLEATGLVERVKDSFDGRGIIYRLKISPASEPTA